MKKILIIEDDSVIAHVYKSRFEQEGYEVEVSADGEAGFHRIHELRPSAVLLDLMLPKMNGIDILKKIRAQKQFACLPVLVFTNAYVPGMIQECHQAGATVFNKACLTPRQITAALHDSIASAERAPKTPITPDIAAPVSETAEFAQPVSDVTVPAVSVPTLAPTREDQEFQAQLAQSFLQKRQETVGLLRKSLHEFCKAPETRRLDCLLELYRKVHSITSSAGLAGLHNIAQIAAAVEVLLKELYDKPRNINASTLRTAVDSIELIANLINRGGQGEVIELTSIDIMVVDDETLSRRAVTYALEKAGMKGSSVEDPELALTLATDRRFDCIFLDVQMPAMDGFELCSKIRALTLNRATPVIFVTSLTDFKSRARSTVSGGNDFIAKPFMFIELSVKALTYVMRSRLSCPILPVAQAA